MEKIEFRPMDSEIETTGRASASASPMQFQEPTRESTYDNHYEHNESCSNCPRDNDPEGHVYYSGCQDTKTYEMHDMAMSNTGRVLEVTMTLKRICPCRRVAVGLLITEVDQSGNEYSRGFKAITVPAHYNSSCCDIEMPTTRFILPEDLRVNSGTSMCDGCRHFVVRCDAHYIDSSVTMP